MCSSDLVVDRARGEVDTGDEPAVACELDREREIEPCHIARRWIPCVGQLPRMPVQQRRVVILGVEATILGGLQDFDGRACGTGRPAAVSPDRPPSRARIEGVELVAIRREPRPAEPRQLAAVLDRP